MSIYSIQICFVYKWTQISTGKWYIGSHYSKTANPNDGYTCSSKTVKPMIKENPEDWNRIILETGSAKDMIQLEHELLSCLNAAKSEYSYNRQNGKKQFYKIGSNDKSTNIKISKSNTGRIFSDEHKQNLSNSAKLRKLSTETKDKISKSLIGNIISQETKDKISKAGKGRINSQQTKDKMSESAKNRKSKLLSDQNIS